MIDVPTSVVLTGGIVAVGQWAQDKPISVRLAVGAGVLAISLSAMEAVDAKLAQKFSLAILLAAILTYVVPITKKLGFAGALRDANQRRIA